MKDKIKVSIRIDKKHQETIEIPRIITSEDELGNKREIALCHKREEDIRKDALALHLLKQILEDKVFSDVSMKTVNLGEEEYFALIMSTYGVKGREKARDVLRNIIRKFDQGILEAISAFERIFK